MASLQAAGIRETIAQFRQQFCIGGQERQRSIGAAPQPVKAVASLTVL